VFGAVSAFASLGMALGPLAGGYIYDTTHGYAWLHAGSFAIGLAAVLIALSFPSKRRQALGLGAATA
jgi:MFS family permease